MTKKSLDKSVIDIKIKGFEMIFMRRGMVKWFFVWLAVEVEIVSIEVVCKDRPDGNIILDFTVK